MELVLFFFSAAFALIAAVMANQRLDEELKRRQASC